jgi:hypothetical protein
MNRVEAVHRIQEARQAHTQWVRRARKLISAPAMDKDLAPVLPTDCAFGNWYYGDGQLLSFLSPFQKIEIAHNELHRIHTEIFDKLFKEPRHSFLLKYFRKSGEQTLADKTKEAKQLLARLEEVSEEIISHTQSLENEISELGDEDFGRYIVSGTSTA